MDSAFVGQRVRHPEFGLGRITGLYAEDFETSKRADVVFDNTRGFKTVLLGYIADAEKEEVPVIIIGPALSHPKESVLGYGWERVVESNNRANEPRAATEPQPESAVSLKESRAQARARVLEFVTSKLALGSTADAVAEAFGCSHNHVAPRLTELKQAGLIVETNERRITRSGRTARVLRVAA